MVLFGGTDQQDSPQLAGCKRQARSIKSKKELNLVLEYDTWKYANTSQPSVRLGGVIAKVTNLENGRSLIVRVNDRGPFKRGRIIDLSRRAAELLGFKNQGTAKVKIQKL